MSGILVGVLEVRLIRDAAVKTSADVGKQYIGFQAYCQLADKEETVHVRYYIRNTDSTSGYGWVRQGTVVYVDVKAMRVETWIGKDGQPKHEVRILARQLRPGPAPKKTAEKPAPAPAPRTSGVYAQTEMAYGPRPQRDSLDDPARHFKPPVPDPKDDDLPFD